MVGGGQADLRGCGGPARALLLPARRLSAPRPGRAPTRAARGWRASSARRRLTSSRRAGRGFRGTGVRALRRRGAEPAEHWVPAPAAVCTASARSAGWGRGLAPAGPVLAAVRGSPSAALAVRPARRGQLPSSPAGRPLQAHGWALAPTPEPMSARDAALLTLGQRPAAPAAQDGSPSPRGRKLGSGFPRPPWRRRQPRTQPCPGPSLCSCCCLCGGLGSRRVR